MANRQKVTDMAGNPKMDFWKMESWTDTSAFWWFLSDPYPTNKRLKRFENVRKPRPKT